MHLVLAVPYLLVLGIIKSFSPTAYGVTIHTLARDRNAVHLVHRIAWGVAAASTLLLLIFAPINPDRMIETFKVGMSRLLLTKIVDLASGIMLVVLSAWLWQRSKRPKRNKTPHSFSGKTAFTFGFLNTLAGTSSIAFMYVTGRVLDGVSHHLPIQIGLYAFFLAGVIGPYLLLIAIWDRFPKLASIITGFFNRVAAHDSRPLVALAVLVAGLVFLGLVFR